MGYTSQDNLIDLSIRVLDFSPDVYILYLGINDYLMQSRPDQFRTDYAHARATLYENLEFSIVERIPGFMLQSKLIQYGLFFCGVPDRRNLLNNTGTALFRQAHRLEGRDKLAVNPMITATVVRNIRSMIGVIRAHNPNALIVLSTFYYEKEEENRNDVHQAILELNRRLLRLADEYDCIPADPVSALPNSPAMVYDYGHFTPAGDKHMGELFAGTLDNHLPR